MTSGSFHPPPTADALRVGVVTHTHWDREWYLPAGRVRQRLVALVDELLDAPEASPVAATPLAAVPAAAAPVPAAPAAAPADGPAAPPAPAASFLLDGQAVVLEDYLAVRPERRDALAALLRTGALEAGPWYVLADELIPSGEALVRNLLLGRWVLRGLGAAPPPVLYSPDAFGHPAALPLLAAGFGHAVIVLWRGLGGPAWPSGDAMWWRAPDGTRALVYHLPPDGYEIGAALPADGAAAAARWERLRRVLAPRATLGLTLLLNGADHHARQPALERAMAALARAAAPAVVTHGTLAGFGAELTRRASHAALPEITGELRNSYGYTWTLQGTLGARAALKRRNAQAERLLVRDAEPWAALAALGGGRSRVPLVRAAWRTLLQAHPHDTLCGCAIDPVARAMAVRLEDAMAQAAGVRDDALVQVIGHDPVLARTRPERWRGAVVVRNAAARPRGGVAEVEISHFHAHVRVGPGSASQGDRTARQGGAAAERPPAFLLDGGAIPVQPLSTVMRHDRIESPVHYPHDDLVHAVRAVAWVGPTPGYGTQTAPIETLPPGGVPGGDGHSGSMGARREGMAGARGVVAGEAWLDNGLLRVEIARDGAVCLRSAASGVVAESLVSFEDVPDRGDLYTHSPAGPPRSDATFLGARVVHRGPLRGELVGRWRLDIAAPRAPHRERTPGRAQAQRRARRPAPLAMSVALTLDAAAPFVRLRVCGRNRARDHRLRLVLDTGIADAVVHADAAFGPVRREPVMAPDGAAEMPPRTAPLARYVTLSDATRGATVYGDGLAEYEAMPDGRVAITLLRAVGELSRADLPERPGHAGWPVPVPQAQAIGPFAARFAVLPHGARDDACIDLVERTADDVLLPLRGDTVRSLLDRPAPTSGVELEGAGLAFSACRESEDGAWMVLRCVNLLARDVTGRWRIARPVREARTSRLDETPGAPLAVVEGAVAFRAPPRSTVTILVQ